MKNFIKLLGIIAFVAVIGFSMASCDLMGGIVEITNIGEQTYNDVQIKGDMSFRTKEKSVAPGETVSFSIEKNGYYQVTFGGGYGYDFSIRGGETVKITIPY